MRYRSLQEPLEATVESGGVEPHHDGAHPLQNGGLGRLGYTYGSGSEQRAPVLVDFGDHKFAEISAAGYHTCALKTDRLAWCWGSTPDNGQAADSNSPKQISGDHTFVAISTGHGTCALDTAGDIWCWGETGRGCIWCI